MTNIERQVTRWEARTGRKGVSFAEFNAGAEIGRAGSTQWNVALKVDGRIVEVLAFNSLRERGIAAQGFDFTGHVLDSAVAAAAARS